MIGYVTLGTNDMERARTFYDALLSELGGARSFATDRVQGYSAGNGPGLLICTPFDREAASVGNGTMVALAAPSRAVVDSMHAAALANGGADEGAPGERMPTFYGAYFRDLDGNKLCVFKMG